LVCLLTVGSFHPIAAQEQFTSGQNIAPVFEGWIRNADGSYNFYFGYLNRNWVEEPTVPVGPENSFSPGPADRGQPTYFLPRRNQSVFSVTVPKDWGPTAELVWTVTLYGSTDRAYGWLKPEWQIDALLIARNAGNQGSRTPEEILKNRPPVIVVDPVQPVALPNVLTLTAAISDDALPVPIPKRTVDRKGLETLSAMPAPVNVPSYRAPSMPRNDLSVRWIVYRGPAPVVFTPTGYQVVKTEGAKRAGKTTATAKFTQPGAYVLRALAADGVAISWIDVPVTVAGGVSQH
jgi:hypothetical protein